MRPNSNILVTIESFWDGGAEIFAIRLANAFALKSNVYFLELYPFQSFEKKQLVQLDRTRIKLFQIGKTILGKWLQNKRKRGSSILIGKLEQLQKTFCDLHVMYILWKYKIKIVSSHSWDTDLYFANLKTRNSFKLISSFHGHYEFLKDIRMNFDNDTSFLLAKVDRVVYTSPNHLETLDQCNFPSLFRHKIYYGNPFSSFDSKTSYDPREKLKFVMVARGIKEKGWQEAIFAISEFLKMYPGKVLLRLVGEGEYLSTLKSKYDSDFIEFLGYRDDVTEIINDSHIGLLPSYYVGESFPNSIIEYLMCGKPVIASNIGAIPEMMKVGEKFAGKCIELENGRIEIGEIFKAIKFYIDHPHKVEEHSTLALEAAKKYSMDNCLVEYYKVFGIIRDNNYDD